MELYSAFTSEDTEALKIQRRCSRSPDRKQRSSCDQWLWLSVAYRVCRRRPTAGDDVQ